MNKKRTYVRHFQLQGYQQCRIARSILVPRSGLRIVVKIWKMGEPVIARSRSFSGPSLDGDVFQKETENLLPTTTST